MFTFICNRHFVFISRRKLKNKHFDNEHKIVKELDYNYDWTHFTTECSTHAVILMEKLSTAQAFLHDKITRVKQEKIDKLRFHRELGTLIMSLPLLLILCYKYL